MSRLPDLPPEPDDDPPRPGDPDGPGRLRPTSSTALAVLGGIGLVGGWLLHPLTERANGYAPLVAWGQPVALAMVAAALAIAAWTTWRSLQVRRERIEPHRAVNRLALAGASAYVGSLVAGGYAGYAVSWLGLADELADERALRSAVAALAAVGIVVGGLVLERACRVPHDDEEP